MAKQNQPARSKKTRQNEIERYREEMDWAAAEARSGSAHGVVISVRLDESDADRLRSLASELDLNMSQVVRRALASFDPALSPAVELRRAVHAAVTHSYVTAFTFGGRTFLGHVSVRPEGSQEDLELSESSTVDTRVRERISA